LLDSVREKKEKRGKRTGKGLVKKFSAGGFSRYALRRGRSIAENLKKEAEVEKKEGCHARLLEPSSTICPGLRGGESGQKCERKPTIRSGMLHSALKAGVGGRMKRGSKSAKRQDGGIGGTKKKLC